MNFSFEPVLTILFIQYLRWNFKLLSFHWNILLISFQKSKELIAMGITGPEGHEMCRPEEVSIFFFFFFFFNNDNHLFSNLEISSISSIVSKPSWYVKEKFWNKMITFKFFFCFFFHQIKFDYNTTFYVWLANSCQHCSYLKKKKKTLATIFWEKVSRIQSIVIFKWMFAATKLNRLILLKLAESAAWQDIFPMCLGLIPYLCHIIWFMIELRAFLSCIAANERNNIQQYRKILYIFIFKSHIYIYIYI